MLLKKDAYPLGQSLLQPEAVRGQVNGGSRQIYQMAATAGYMSNGESRYASLAMFSDEAGPPKTMWKIMSLLYYA